tara:strand:- start:1294 stop:1863 length:570 start_codon:yes stop_codon:yes gene_type:complete
MEINTTKLSNGITYGNVDFECLIQANDNNNCSVRSLASAFKVSYKKAYYGAQMLWNREDGCGISGFDANKLGDVKTLWNEPIARMGEVVEGEGFGRTVLGKMYHIGGGEKKFRRMSTGTFFKTYTEGSFMLVVNGHMFAYVDGQVQGNYSDATMLKRPIESAYRVGRDLVAIAKKRAEREAKRMARRQS